MKQNPRVVLVTLVTAACAVLPLRAMASDMYGLLRSRDLTPFGFLRLDMRPAHAIAIKPGSWSIEAELGYQNTWALSPRVEEYLTGLEPTGRRRLGPEEVAAIYNLPGENYLVDLESASLDVTFHYKFSKYWTAYLIASAVSYQGGFLDGAIEDFHDTFGFSSFGRSALLRNQVNIVYNLKSTQYTSLGPPTDGGIEDPTVGLRYVGFQFSDKWRVSLEAAVKVPVTKRRVLVSTGRTDYGLQGALQYRLNRQAFYLDLAGVYYAGGDFPVRQNAQIVPTVIAGYEFALTARTNVNLQGYFSQSVYSHKQTDLQELTGDKYQVTVGVRHRMDSFLLSFGLTENLQNLNNTPDIGFQVGLSWIPDRVPLGL